MKKIYLLDADGVVIAPRVKYFSQRYMEDFGVPRDLIMQFFKNEFEECLVGKRELREVFEEQKLLKKWQWKGSLDELLEYWFSGENTRNEPVLALVKELRAHGAKCYLTTDQERNRAEYFMQRMRLGEELDGTFFSYELGARKTSPEYWQKVLEKLGNPKPEDVVFWDDDEENVAAAKNAGIDAHLFVGVEDFKKTVSI